MVFLHCSNCPPYGEIKKFWNTSLVPIQWAKPHDATKMPQLLCVKLEDPKNFTSQALRRSRAVIHLGTHVNLLYCAFGIPAHYSEREKRHHMLPYVKYFYIRNSQVFSIAIIFS